MREIQEMKSFQQTHWKTMQRRTLINLTFATSVHAATDPSLGAETLETVIIVNALACTTTHHILALPHCPPQSLRVAHGARLYAWRAGLLHFDERVHHARAWRETREAIGLVRSSQHYVDPVLARAHVGALPEDSAWVEIVVTAFGMDRSR